MPSNPRTVSALRSLILTYLEALPSKTVTIEWSSLPGYYDATGQVVSLSGAPYFSGTLTWHNTDRSSVMLSPLDGANKVMLPLSGCNISTFGEDFSLTGETTGTDSSWLIVFAKGEGE